MTITFDLENEFERETASERFKKFLKNFTPHIEKLDALKELCADGLDPTRDLEEAGPNECRWPYSELRVCGRECTGTYCEVHHARAISKTQPAGSKS